MADDGKQEPIEIIKDANGDERRPAWMQRVFIKFSNGKVGVFSGPAIFSSAEMKLVKLDIADIAFSEPFQVMVRVPKQTEGVTNAATESPKQ